MGARISGLELSINLGAHLQLNVGQGRIARVRKLASSATRGKELLAAPSTRRKASSTTSTVATGLVLIEARIADDLGGEGRRGTGIARLDRAGPDDSIADIACRFKRW